MIIVLPLLIAIVGVLVYFASNNAKAQEVGRLMFAVGLLAFLLRGGEAIALLGK